MKKPYLIIVNGVLAGRKLTKSGALNVIQSFTDKGIIAALAYELDNGTFEPVRNYND